MFRRYIAMISIFLVLFVMTSIIVVAYQDTKLERFEAKVKAQQQKQREIEVAEGQSFIMTIMVFPMFFGETLGMTIEKLKLIGEALTIPEIPKRKIAKELFIDAPKRAAIEFKESMKPNSYERRK